ncbi:MAG: MscL family protein [Actinobacteria bacterium]|nr:MscL family protein [Actinomycetota bacterium]
MIKGFREFVFRGNVIDLAVAVAVGTALAALVAAVTKALIDPIVVWFVYVITGGKAIDGGPTLPGGAILNIGLLVTGLITFFITLTVLYLVFVLPMNKYRQRMGQSGIDARPADVQLLEEIRDLLKEQQGKK